MENIPNTATRTEEGSSDVTTTSITISKSLFLPGESDGVDKETGGGGIVVTPQEMGSTSSTQTMTTKLPPAPTTGNFTEFTVWTEDFWNSSSPSTPPMNLLVTTNISIVNDTNVSVVTGLIPEEGDVSCVEWEAAQHNLFQTANLFFAAAFIVPRSFKQSLLLLRLT
jgi:hypothetical protein